MNKMNIHKFKEILLAPANYQNSPYENVNVSAMHTYSNSKNVFIRALIGRTVRLTLQYPELAQKYLDSLPKVVNEDNLE
jgi:hypothetical protein